MRWGTGGLCAMPSSFRHLQRFPRGSLHRVPRCALPPGARRACRRVLHPRGVEGRSPAALVILRELEIVALTVHPHRDMANPSPRVEPGAKGPERPIIRGHGAPGEADSSTEELAVLVKHATRSPDPLAVTASAGS